MTLTRWVHNYVERHTASTISELVELRCQDAEFLHSAKPEVVALFQRNEIKTGAKLGSGAFSEVFEVSRIKLLKTGQSLCVEEARMTCRWNTERGKYAIKLPQKPGKRELLGSSRRNRGSSGRDSLSSSQKFPEYTKAAIDLIIEAKFLSVMDHKHIIKVRGLNCGPSPFIIMDRLDDTLDRRILTWRQEQCASEETLMMRTTFALQMAEAIQYLHDRRIVIRDVKPANVGFKKDIDGQDIVQLFDMGLCRELPHAGGNDQEEFRMSMAGTLRYMSPEIINTGVYGLKADVYSWAIVAFEMITLEIPYRTQCVNPTMHRRFVCREGERPSFPQEGLVVPASLQKLIQASWAQEAPERPQIASVCCQLQSLLDAKFQVKTYTPPAACSLSFYETQNTVSASA